MLNLCCFFAYARTCRHGAGGVCLDTIAFHMVTRFSAVLLSVTFCARYRGLMHVESSTMLDRILFELHLDGVASYCEVTFI